MDLLWRLGSRHRLTAIVRTGCEVADPGAARNRIPNGLNYP